MSTPIDEQVSKQAVPSVGASLSAALDDMEATPLRRPRQEFAWFLTLCLPLLAFLIATMGLRRDLGGLSPLWMVGMGLVWFASFAASAFLGFVPARGHVVPRSRQIYQALALSLLVLIALGLFATQEVPGMSVTYEADLSSFWAHARSCAMMGFVTGVLPGTIALLAFRRFVPVGRVSMGIGLGAAGGALAGVFLLFHCPVSERFHMALAHTSGIASAALFVAVAGWLLLRER